MSARASTIDVLDATGSKSGTVELPAEIFDVQVNIPLIHQVVVAQRAAARQGTADTKTRAEVAGGGAKPYRQKGTGRARQGSIRAPQFTGGGVVHGPTPRDYSQRTPKKMKAAALRGALSDRAREGRVHVVEGVVDGDAPSTKSALSMLAKLTERPRTLVVLERSDDVGWLSLRNVDTIHVLTVDQINTYDVLLSDDVVFTKSAYDVLAERLLPAAKAAAPSPETTDDAASKPSRTTAPKLAKPAAAKADKVAKPAAAKADKVAKPAMAVQTDEPAVPSEQAPFGAGSAAALESGEAPEGFTIKGNTTSMKYHEPEGRWYEQTVAEVWFSSGQEAERAGFVKAGSKASVRASADKAKEDGQ